MNIKKAKWLIVAAPAASTLLIGYTVGLLTPHTGDRIRSTVDVAGQQWQHGEVRDTELTEVEDLRQRVGQAELERDQLLIELGNVLKLADSDHEVHRLAQERTQLAEDIAETLIQDRLSSPMLMLAPTPEEVEADPVPEAQEVTAGSAGAPPTQPGGGA